jgi:hypothetical protein
MKIYIHPAIGWKDHSSGDGRLVFSWSKTGKEVDVVFDGFCVESSYVKNQDVGKFVIHFIKKYHLPKLRKK